MPASESESTATIDINLWIPKRSDERVAEICEEINGITKTAVEIEEQTAHLIQLSTSAASFDECAAIESWLPGEFPDHEKWVDSSDSRFVLRISPSPPGTVSVLNQAEADRFTNEHR